MSCGVTEQARLIIGIGNALRGDDGVGVAVVERFAAAAKPNLSAAKVRVPGSSLEDSLRAGLTRTLACHQLTPDLAMDVHESSGVVFVDASCELPAGEVRMQRIAPATTDPPIGHQIGPEHLLALTQAMFGSVPPAWTLAVGAARFDHDQTLSQPVADAIEPMLECLNAWVTQSEVRCA